MNGYTDEYGRRIDFVPMPASRRWIGKRVCGRVHGCERCARCEAYYKAHHAHEGQGTRARKRAGR